LIKVSKLPIQVHDEDTPNGAYGANGIYRANNFRDGNFTRRGMGVHSGREHLPFERRVTNGCIRTTPECMDAIQNAIDNFGPLNRVILEEIQPPIIPNREPDQIPIPNFDPRVGPPQPRPVIPPIDPLPLPRPNPQPLPVVAA